MATVGLDGGSALSFHFRTHRTGLWAAGLLLLAGCALPEGRPGGTANQDTAAPSKARIPVMAPMHGADVYGGTGISGLAPLADGRALVVHDTKALPQDDGSVDLTQPYVSLLSFGPATLTPLPLSAAEGLELGRAPSDIEALCRLSPQDPEAPSEESLDILAFESGDFRDLIRARIYRLRIDLAAEGGAAAQITDFIELDGAALAFVEGALCLPLEQSTAQSSSLLVLLAERGGPDGSDPARIRRFMLSLEPQTTQDAPRWSEGEPTQLLAPWPAAYGPDFLADAASTGTNIRHISDIAGPHAGQIWLAGATDAGDQGPFYSLVYRLPVRCVLDPEAAKGCGSDATALFAVPGLKVEGLTGPMALGDPFLLGTDDEDFGGKAWAVGWSAQTPARR